MKKSLLILLTSITIIGSFQAAKADGLLNIFKRKYGIEPITDPLYEESCGECHFAYQPGWLPKASWKKLLEPSALEDHFGENAELEEEDRVKVLKFLTENAADDSSYRLSKKIMHSLKKGQTPIKMSKTRYLHRKHDEIPPRYITGNKKVRLLSNCDRCHTGAKKGIFEEDTVVIPGFGPWNRLDDD